MTPPTLLAVAHGSRDPAGAATVAALLTRVRALRPWLRVAMSYAELSAPSLEEAADEIDGPMVAVPLLLGRGHHALVDIPERMQEICPEAMVARPLGPHSLLSAALLERLGAERRANPGAAVVLGAAGSSDPGGIADVRVAARLLTRRLGRPVPYGFVGHAGPALRDTVEGLRKRGAERVAVASYLLAPGAFHDRMKQAGADVVSLPLGAHDAVARLVLRRFDEACARSRTALATG